MNEANDNLDIEVRLQLGDNDELPAEFVLDGLQALNEAVYASELADIRACRKSFSNLPDVAFDAAEHRIKGYRRSSVRVAAINKGSLEIAVVVAGVAIWVLQKTLGETLKESWLESDSHRQLKQFLTKRRLEKVEDICTRAQARVAKKLPGEVDCGHEQSLSNTAGGRAIVRIRVRLRPSKKYPVRRSDAFRKN